MSKRNQIVEVLESMDMDTFMQLYYDYVDATDRYDERIYTVDDLDMLTEGQYAYWLLCRAYYGDFNPLADYFILNGYGNIVSIFSHNLQEYVSFGEIADYCIENSNSFDNDEIDEILNDEEEGDDDE